MVHKNSDRERLDIRLKASEKAVLARAAALRHQDLTGFILNSALPKAEEVIRDAEQVQLSKRDSVHVLNLLENPPSPTERLIRAAKAVAE